MAKELLQHSTETALRERVKELTCLYGISLLAQQPELSDDAVLQGIVELLPPAWQYPEIALARIVVDDSSYVTPGFRETPYGQVAQIVADSGKFRVVVEVFYSESRPQLGEGPFLKEERHLIDAVARDVAAVIERRQAERHNSALQDQLRHADRLATIGMLAAGVAHELNEPLGNILGFAQLAQKCPRLPRAARVDMEKVQAESLHAREIIRKLLVFARQAPPQKKLVDLNQIVRDGLYFLETRCVKEGVDLECSLMPDLPEIVADASQLNQILTNLVVNSLQAMDGGGQLSVSTCHGDGHVVLAVEDTGTGMERDTLDKIFVPFFTTKDIGEGTGLGLPVVHGIVTSHGGTVDVRSSVGRGTRFEIRLPAEA